MWDLTQRENSSTTRVRLSRVKTSHALFSVRTWTYPIKSSLQQMGLKRHDQGCGFNTSPRGLPVSEVVCFLCCDEKKKLFSLLRRGGLRAVTCACQKVSRSAVMYAYYRLGTFLTCWSVEWSTKYRPRRQIGVTLVVVLHYNRSTSESTRMVASKLPKHQLTFSCPFVFHGRMMRLQDLDRYYAYVGVQLAIECNGTLPGITKEIFSSLRSEIT